MSFPISRRAIPLANDPANRDATRALTTAVNELSGSTGDPAQRAARIGELFELGLLQITPDGIELGQKMIELEARIKALEP